MSGGMEDGYADAQMQMLTEMRALKNSAPHAKHYQQLVPEPIDVIESWDLSFNMGNALKYIARAEHKGNKTADLEKAIWYLKRELLMCKD